MSSPPSRYLLSLKSYLVVMLVLAGFIACNQLPRNYIPWRTDDRTGMSREIGLSRSDYVGYGWPMIFRAETNARGPLISVS